LAVSVRVRGTNDDLVRPVSYALFDHISCQSADSLNCQQRPSAPIAYYPKTNATFHTNLQLHLVTVSSLLSLSGDVHFNPGPVCQPNEVGNVVPNIFQLSGFAKRMVRFSLLVSLEVMTGHVYFSCELPWPCCMMVFPYGFRM
jgi:hypothetical protein